MKKIIALTLALLLVLACLTGCADKETPVAEDPIETSEPEAKEEAPAEEAKEEPKEEAAEETAEEPTAPTDPDFEIIWMVANEEGVRPDTEPAIKKEIESRYNVKITIPDVDVHNPEEVEAYFANGGRFDVISLDNYLPFIEEGRLREIPEGWLDSYMPDWMTSIRGLTHKSDVIIKIDTSYDGKQYVVPYGDRATTYAMGIRQDWLDNLGLEVPSTLDELYNVFYAFTFNDPDGNGSDDTWGFVPGGGIWNSWGYIEDCFYDSPAAYLPDENGVVSYPAISENRREFLRVAKAFMYDGIVYPQANADKESLFESGKVGCICEDIDNLITSWDSCWAYKLMQNNPDARVTVMDPLVNEDGKQYFCAFGYNSPLANSKGFAFGADCPDEVMQRVMQVKNDLVTDYNFYSQANKDSNVLLGKAPINMDWWGPYLYTEEFGELNRRFANFDGIILYKGLNPMDTCEEFSTYDGGMQSIADKFWWDCLYNQNICDPETDWDDYVSNMYEAGTQAVCDGFTAIAQSALGK